MINYQPIKIIDNNNPDSVYIGVSVNGNSTNKNVWQIKRIEKNDNIWYTKFPNGNQSYDFVWDDRFTYDYE